MGDTRRYVNTIMSTNHRLEYDDLLGILSELIVEYKSRRWAVAHQWARRNLI